jgi:NADPH:quinone reductase-like Zn-dependent oxidoreductase
MTTVSELPKLMTAAVVDAPGPPNVLHIKDVPLPSLPSNHVIIALEYAGVGILGR